MSDDFLPFHPEFSSAFGRVTLAELKYNYVLQNVIFYAIHVGDDHTLLYYKDGSTEVDENPPAVINYLLSEFEASDFNDRFWQIRNWVTTQRRGNIDCNISFTHQTYRELIADLSHAETEAEDIISQRQKSL